MKQTGAFHAFLRGVAERRSALLKSDLTPGFIYPPAGTIWNPSKKDLAKCDAFILFFVAELEHYFEWVLESSINKYSSAFKLYFLKNCRAGEEYIQKTASKIVEVGKNNNANWKKISSHFEFVGMGKESHFPVNYWDDIESVVAHRGHIAHNGARMRTQQDRRDIFKKIELTIKRTRYFDENFQEWLTSVDTETNRLPINNLNFSPPPFSIS